MENQNYGQKQISIRLVTLRSFILIVLFQFLVQGCVIDPNSLGVDAPAEKYPQILISHIEGWNKADVASEPKPSTYLEIDQLAFYENIRLVKTQLLRDSSKLMVVIKSDAYGHGLELLATVAQIAGADYFGITENSSLVTMQRMGLNTPVVRLRLASNEELIAVHSNRDVYGDVEEMVGNFQMVELLSSIGEQQGRKIKVHLNLNSGGMSRNGFDVNVLEIREQMIELLQLSNIEIVGIMTHFPNADAADIGETRRALANFKEQADRIIEDGNLQREDILLHAANTSATLRLPESHLDMVRVGSLVFGEKLEDEAPPSLQQLMSVYSTVGQINFYPEGSVVGYGSSYTLQRDSYLANIPIGKNNGIPRDLVEVLIGGKRYPMVGSMSMNTTMIDITDGWEEIESGNEVVIFGRQYQDEIRVEEHWRSTISDIHSFMGQLNRKARYSKP